MPSFSAPPRPCLALRIGVTGHRPGPRLPAGEIDRVTAEVVSILDDVAEAARQAQQRYTDAFDPAPPDLRLVSALAEGADRIAAKAALASSAASACQARSGSPPGVGFLACGPAKSQRRIVESALDEAMAFSSFVNARPVMASS